MQELQRKSDPKYDEDVVNLRYFKKNMSAGGNADIKSMTKAQYDALTDKTGVIITTDEYNASTELQPVGSIYYSDNDTNPNSLFGGTWIKDRIYYGGELLAYGIATTAGQTAGTLITDGTATPFSATSVGGKVYTDVNYVPGILTGVSGAILIQTKGIVGMVEADMYISGYGAAGLRGFWWLGHATGNTLPSGVTVLRNTGTYGNILTTGPYDANYGGGSNKYIYSVDSASDLQFFVNPMFSPYAGSFTPSKGGVACQLIVKVFSKHGTTYAWKRTA